MRSGARIRNKELMRERILRRDRVFAEEGFDAPVDHICERAGVSKVVIGILF